MNKAHKPSIEVRTKELNNFDDQLYKMLSKNNKAILKAVENAISKI